MQNPEYVYMQPLVISCLFQVKIQLAFRRFHHFLWGSNKRKLEHYHLLEPALGNCEKGQRSY